MELRKFTEPASAKHRERGSKFMSFAWPVTTVDEINEHLKTLRKKYYDATHICFAYRLGPTGDVWRAYDDREPSGTAGTPIYGQLRSAGVTDCLVAVVRYFGGTKLGTPGLIKAYKEAAREVLQHE